MPRLSGNHTTANRRIILACDNMSLVQAQGLCEQLKPYIWGPKFNDLYAMYGTAICGAMRDVNNIFVDAKWHDIPTTMQNCIAKFDYCDNFSFATVHCSGGLEMLQAVREKRDQLGMKVKLLGVTVLTSLDGKPCERIYGAEVANKVYQFASFAAEAGLDGVVCSGHELRLLNCGQNDNGIKKLLKVVTAIREEGSPKHDQKRTCTVEQAVDWGGDYFVIGKEITQANDPVAAAQMFVEKIEGAMVGDHR